MTVDQIIDGILIREGGYVDSAADRGGCTNLGITAVVLGEWRQLGRAATRQEVRDLPESEARAIYRVRYVEDPGFRRVLHVRLQALLVDIGVNSGPVTAVKMLQRALGFTGRFVDGVLGKETIASLGAADTEAVYRDVLKARVDFYLALALDGPDVKAFLKANPKSQLTFARGWIRRALEFA